MEDFLLFSNWFLGCIYVLFFVNSLRIFFLVFSLISRMYLCLCYFWIHWGFPLTHISIHGLIISRKQENWLAFQIYIVFLLNLLIINFFRIKKGFLFVIILGIKKGFCLLFGWFSIQNNECTSIESILI